MSGTPKTIEQAIVNALESRKCQSICVLHGDLSAMAEVIRLHVKDFIAQKANCDDAAIELFNRIFPESGPSEAARSCDYEHQCGDQACKCQIPF